MPEDIVAIKSLKISKLSPDDKAHKINFNYSLGHCYGYMRSDLAPAYFWNTKLPQKEEDNNLAVFVLSYELDDYEMVADFKFKTIH